MISGIWSPPKLIVGTMNFAGAMDERAARATVERALDVGLSTFDTANAYGNGAAESCLGAALKGCDAAVITKVGRRMVERKPEGLAYQVVCDAAKASADRLGRPIDLLLWHARDPETPWEEPLRAMETLLADGTIRHWGLSNHWAWEAVAIDAAAQKAGIKRPSHIQVLYNILLRDAEQEYFSLAQSVGRGSLSLSAYNPLAGGLLARSSLAPSPSVTKSRLARVPLYKQRYGSQTFAERVAALEEIAVSCNLSLRELAYRFLASAPLSVVLGPRAPEHLDGVAPLLPLSPEISAAIDALHRAWRGTVATALG